MIKYAFLAMGTVICGVIHAATYYAGPSATGDGSSETFPGKQSTMISHAIARNDGSTVVMLPGTYKIGTDVGNMGNSDKSQKTVNVNILRRRRRPFAV